MIASLSLSRIFQSLCRQQIGNITISKGVPAVFLRHCSKDVEKTETENRNDTESKKDGGKDTDRSKEIPVETSIKYMRSAAYKQAYGEYLVWEQYRRNFKGAFAPRKTRKTCIRKGVVATGNPCPICRDEYLVLHHENLGLLHQFISPHSGEVLPYSKTGLCQRKHLELLIAVERAKDRGLLTFDVPFRHYDYSEYYGDQKDK